MIIRQSDLFPGDCVSVDQYVCHQKGRLPHTKGKEKDKQRYSGGLIALDHASGYIYISTIKSHFIVVKLLNVKTTLKILLEILVSK